jgi:hypothetical protein
MNGKPKNFRLLWAVLSLLMLSGVIFAMRYNALLFLLQDITSDAIKVLVIVVGFVATEVAFGLVFVKLFINALKKDKVFLKQFIYVGVFFLVASATIFNIFQAYITKNQIHLEDLGSRQIWFPRYRLSIHKATHNGLVIAVSLMWILIASVIVSPIMLEGMNQLHKQVKYFVLGMINKIKNIFKNTKIVSREKNWELEVETEKQTQLDSQLSSFQNEETLSSFSQIVARFKNMKKASTPPSHLI